MKSRITSIASVVLSASLAAAMVVDGAGGAAQAGDSAKAAATEDVIYMRDGRVLHGQIISESNSEVVFQYVDRKLNLQTKLTLRQDEIAKIERDLPLKESEAAAASGSTTTSKPTSSGGKKPSEPERTYGASRAAATDSRVPSFYIVPMTGQMGTDVNEDIYKHIKKDILEIKPDYLIIKMECLDEEDALYSVKGREEAGLADLDEFRQVINLFRDDLRDIKQVMWIHDSVGVSSVVAMAWPDLYMKPTARLGGMVAARDQTGFDRWQDDDVRGKMTAAFMGWIKGFLEYGRYDFALADAMVQPKYELSATWHGRDVKWSLDQSGEYTVDASADRTAEFRAKDAEDFCISDGTAETLEDLALLLGIREFRVVENKGESIFNGYVEDWRRDYEKCKTWMADYQQFMGWASGEDTVKYLGQAKNRLEDILGAIERYKAVEIRLLREFGLNRTDLTVMIEQIKEQLRALKNSGRGSGGGGRGSGGGGGRLGGGGR